MDELSITEIWIYPVKSLGGIRLKKASAGGKGLAFDRRWMLIDDAGAAMTQRTFPAMALFRPELSAGSVRVTYSKSHKPLGSIEFSINPPTSPEWISTSVWGDAVKVAEVDRDVSAWFSRHLGTRCRLVAFPEENTRPVDPEYSINNEQVSLADAFPFLIIGQSALDDLNSRLDEAVPMNRFRPNFVFSGGDPYIEDRWKNVLIGKVPFAGVKKSARCVLTTVNQDTGEKGSEPLRTLSTFRKVGTNVYFGQNLVALGSGEVSIGDRVIPT